MFSSFRFGVSGLVVLLGATLAQAEPRWSQSVQREQIHQQYLTPSEHRAVHGAGNYGSTYQQPAYRPQGGFYGSNYGQPGYGNLNSGNTAYGNSGSWNGSYQSQYPAGRSYTSGSGCGNSGNYSRGYGNSGYSSQFGGHYR
jgi:hypothetical protein